MFNAECYLRRYLQNPRRIYSEVQTFADGKMNTSLSFDKKRFICLTI